MNFLSTSPLVTITIFANSKNRVTFLLLIKFVESRIKFIEQIHRLDLTTFLFYLSKITSNLPENYLSKSKTTS